MSSEPSGYVPVDTGLVVSTLIERIFGIVEGRRDDDPPQSVAAVLAGTDLPLVGTEAQIEADLRYAGYLARVVEVELFEPARQPADWLGERLTAAIGSNESWDEAVTAICVELALAEPVGKPSPEDDAAKSWQVPGPGGHVRHFLARRTIEEYLADAEAPVAEDPAELKRPWMYGFFVRACEEAVPPEAPPSKGD